MNAGSCLDRPSSSAWQSEGFVNLKGFEEFLLKDRRKSTVKQSLSYAKKYAQILRTGDASELLKLTPKNRQHAMRSLACLSKFMGVYSDWKEIKEKYGLKWSTDDPLQYFRLMTDGKHDYSVMLSWLKSTFGTLPKAYSNILVYCTLTGLRPAEACASIELIHKDLSNYLSQETMILEHYKYPAQFIRKTKKAYISIVNPPILEVAQKSGDVGYNALRLAVKHKGMEMHMGYCRKIFATHLRINGIPQETIDLLQGRVPASVFGRHYFRDFNRDGIRKALDSLYTTLTV
jgi:hypothetical protein